MAAACRSLHLGPPAAAASGLASRPARAQQPPAVHRNAAHAAARRAVRAAARRSGGGGGRGGGKPRLSEAEAFEQLMVDWDDAFAADCADTEKAVVVARLAEEGYKQHGRGFVFVRSQLEKRSRKSTKGAGIGSSSAPKGFGALPQRPAEQGTPLPNNPQLRLLSWTATFIPGRVLDALGGVFTAAEGGAVLPDSEGLLAGSSFGGSSSGGGSKGGSSGGTGSGDKAVAAIEELQRVMRGQDASQLRAMVGMPALPAPAAGDDGSSQDAAAASGGGGSGSGAEEQQQQGEEEDAAALAAREAEVEGMMGVTAYEPEAGELVVLLAAKIGGKPATGAERLAVVRREDGSTVLEMPDGWEEALAMA